MKRERQFPEHVQRTVDLAKKLMPEDGNLDGFVQNAAAHRGRQILVRSQTFELQQLSGLWLRGTRADALVLAEPITPYRRTATICHEIAHMLLGHSPVEDTDLDLVAEASPDLPPELLARGLARHAFGSPGEGDAELVATMIATECAQRQVNSSRLR